MSVRGRERYRGLLFAAWVCFSVVGRLFVIRADFPNAAKEIAETGFVLGDQFWEPKILQIQQQICVIGL